MSPSSEELGAISACIELDQSFLHTMRMVESMVPKTDKRSQIRVKQWIAKLKEPTNNVVWRRNRNNYARLLMEQLKSGGTLLEPFNALPKQGHLPTLPLYMKCRFIASPSSPSPTPGKMCMKLLEAKKSNHPNSGTALRPPAPRSSIPNPKGATSKGMDSSNMRGPRQPQSLYTDQGMSPSGHKVHQDMAPINMRGPQKEGSTATGDHNQRRGPHQPHSPTASLRMVPASAAQSLQHELNCQLDRDLAASLSMAPASAAQSLQYELNSQLDRDLAASLFIAPASAVTSLQHELESQLDQARDREMKRNAGLKPGVQAGSMHHSQPGDKCLGHVAWHHQHHGALPEAHLHLQSRVEAGVEVEGQAHPKQASRGQEEGTHHPQISATDALSSYLCQGQSEGQLLRGSRPQAHYGTGTAGDDSRNTAGSVFGMGVGTTSDDGLSGDGAAARGGAGAGAGRHKGVGALESFHFSPAVLNALGHASSSQEPSSLTALSHGRVNTRGFGSAPSTSAALRTAPFIPGANHAAAWAADGTGQDTGHSSTEHAAADVWLRLQQVALNTDKLLAVRKARAQGSASATLRERNVRGASTNSSRWPSTPAPLVSPLQLHTLSAAALSSRGPSPMRSYQGGSSRWPSTTAPLVSPLQLHSLSAATLSSRGPSPMRSYQGGRSREPVLASGPQHCALAGMHEAHPGGGSISAACMRLSDHKQASGLHVSCEFQGIRGRRASAPGAPAAAAAAHAPPQQLSIASSYESHSRRSITHLEQPMRQPSCTYAATDALPSERCFGDPIDYSSSTTPHANHPPSTPYTHHPLSALHMRRPLSAPLMHHPLSAPNTNHPPSAHPTRKASDPADLSPEDMEQRGSNPSVAFSFRQQLNKRPPIALRYSTTPVAPTVDTLAAPTVLTLNAPAAWNPAASTAASAPGTPGPPTGWNPAASTAGIFATPKAGTLAASAAGTPAPPTASKQAQPTAPQPNTQKFQVNPAQLAPPAPTFSTAQLSPSRATSAMLNRLTGFQQTAASIQRQLRTLWGVVAPMSSSPPASGREVDYMSPVKGSTRGPSSPKSCRQLSKSAFPPATLPQSWRRERSSNSSPILTRAPTTSIASPPPPMTSSARGVWARPSTAEVSSPTHHVQGAASEPSKRLRPALEELGASSRATSERGSCSVGGTTEVGGDAAVSVRTCAGTGADVHAGAHVDASACVQAGAAAGLNIHSLTGQIGDTGQLKQPAPTELSARLLEALGNAATKLGAELLELGACWIEADNPQSMTGANNTSTGAHESADGGHRSERIYVGQSGQEQEAHAHSELLIGGMHGAGLVIGGTSGSGLVNEGRHRTGGITYSIGNARVVPGGVSNDETGLGADMELTLHQLQSTHLHTATFQPAGSCRPHQGPLAESERAKGEPPFASQPPKEGLCQGEINHQKGEVMHHKGEVMHEGGELHHAALDEDECSMSGLHQVAFEEDEWSMSGLHHDPYCDVQAPPARDGGSNADPHHTLAAEDEAYRDVQAPPARDGGPHDVAAAMSDQPSALLEDANQEASERTRDKSFNSDLSAKEAVGHFPSPMVGMGDTFTASQPSPFPSDRSSEGLVGTTANGVPHASQGSSSYSQCSHDFESPGEESHSTTSPTASPCTSTYLACDLPDEQIDKDTDPAADDDSSGEHFSKDGPAVGDGLGDHFSQDVNHAVDEGVGESVGTAVNLAVGDGLCESMCTDEHSVEGETPGDSSGEDTMAVLKEKPDESLLKGVASLLHGHGPVESMGLGTGADVDNRGDEGIDMDGYSMDWSEGSRAVGGVSGVMDGVWVIERSDTGSAGGGSLVVEGSKEAMSILDIGSVSGLVDERPSGGHGCGSGGGRTQRRDRVAGEDGRGGGGREIKSAPLTEHEHSANVVVPERGAHARYDAQDGDVGVLQPMEVEGGERTNIRIDVPPALSDPRSIDFPSTNTRIDAPSAPTAPATLSLAGASRRIGAGRAAAPSIDVTGVAATPLLPQALLRHLVTEEGRYERDVPKSGAAKGSTVQGNTRQSTARQGNVLALERSSDMDLDSRKGQKAGDVSDQLNIPPTVPGYDGERSSAPNTSLVGRSLSATRGHAHELVQDAESCTTEEALVPDWLLPLRKSVRQLTEAQDQHIHQFRIMKQGLRLDGEQEAVHWAVHGVGVQGEPVSPRNIDEAGNRRGPPLNIPCPVDLWRQRSDEEGAAKRLAAYRKDDSTQSEGVGLRERQSQVGRLSRWCGEDDYGRQGGYEGTAQQGVDDYGQKGGYESRAQQGVDGYGRRGRAAGRAQQEVMQEVGVDRWERAVREAEDGSASLEHNKPGHLSIDGSVYKAGAQSEDASAAHLREGFLASDHQSATNTFSTAATLSHTFPSATAAFPSATATFLPATAALLEEGRASDVEYYKFRGTMRRAESNNEEIMADFQRLKERMGLGESSSAVWGSFDLQRSQKPPCYTADPSYKSDKAAFTAAYTVTGPLTEDSKASACDTSDRPTQPVKPWETSVPLLERDRAAIRDVVCSLPGGQLGNLGGGSRPVGVSSAMNSLSDAVYWKLKKDLLA
eukprot:gene8244-1513_t